MFTLRFMSGADSAVVSGARYDTRHFMTSDQMRAESCIVTVYPQPTSDIGGVEFHVGGEEHQYPVCYVENQSGKTIDRVGPFQTPDLQAARMAQ